MLERLHGENAPERLFTTVADIGPKLAQRIHEELGIETLSELSAAAHDGRLARVRGMGGKRVQAVREALAGRFRQDSSAHAVPARREAESLQPPPLEELLDVDREYRQLARQGKLPRIAPRRFNPTGDAWLPVLHTEREGRHYTALYSNTARAHELGTTHDWVVIYCDDDQRGGSWTAITANYGALRGHRVIRGREDECARHYALDAGPATRRLVQKRFPF
jgi:putative hydrolase